MIKTQRHAHSNARQMHAIFSSKGPHYWIILSWGCDVKISNNWKKIWFDHRNNAKWQWHKWWQDILLGIWPTKQSVQHVNIYFVYLHFPVPFFFFHIYRGIAIKPSVEKWRMHLWGRASVSIKTVITASTHNQCFNAHFGRFNTMVAQIESSVRQPFRPVY